MWESFAVVHTEFFLTTRAETRKSHPKADSGGFPPPWSCFLRTHKLVKWLCCVESFLVLKIFRLPQRKLSWLLERTYFPAKSCNLFPWRWNLHPCFNFLIGLEQGIQQVLGSFYNSSRKGRKNRFYHPESSFKGLAGIRRVSWTLRDPRWIKAVHLIYTHANIMLLNAEVLSECSLVTICEGRVLKVLMWSIKRERAWE